MASGDALIEVEVANVTFVETQIRAARPPQPAMTPRLPAIIGNGVGGRVIEVGGEVDEALLGSRVVSSTGGTGDYAELAAVPASGVIFVPEGLSQRQVLAPVLALLADGRTAMLQMRLAEVGAGETVLVEAAPAASGRCSSNSLTAPAPPSWPRPAASASSRSGVPSRERGCRARGDRVTCDSRQDDAGGVTAPPVSLQGG